MSFFNNRATSALEKEKASARLDAFLSVLYLYPNCLEVEDVDLLAQRESELSLIYKYAGRGFFFTYFIGVAGFYGFRRGTTPFFKDVVMHSVLGVTGTFCAANISEKIAAETHYNSIMIQMSDKYNFTAEEVMDLQRNLN